MGASPQAQANFSNTILALARLQEVEKAGITQAALRREKQMETMEKTQKLQAANREEEFKRQVGSMTGVGVTPETEALFAGSKQLMQPGVTTPEFLPQPERSPMGFAIPTQVLATPSRQTLKESFRREGDVARQETLASFQRRGMGPGTPLYEEAATQSKIPIPSTAVPRIKEQEESEGRRATLMKTRGDIALQEQTYEKEAELRPSRLRKSEEEAEQTRLSNVAKRHELSWAPLKAAQEAELRELDAQLKRLDVAADPAKQAKIQAEIQGIKLRNRQAQYDFEKGYKIDAALDQVAKMPEGPAKRIAMRQVGTLQGHVLPLMVEDRQMNESYRNASKMAIEADLSAKELIGKGDVQGAQQLTQEANKWRTQAGALMDSPTTTLNTVVPGGGGLFGTSGAQTSSVVVKTPLAQLYDTRRMHEAAKGVAAVENPYATNPSERVIPPGWALEQIVRIEHDYAKGDVGALTRIINRMEAPPEVKADAIQRLQKPSADIRTSEQTFAGESTVQPGGGPKTDETGRTYRVTPPLFVRPPGVIPSTEKGDIQKDYESPEERERQRTQERRLR